MRLQTLISTSVRKAVDPSVWVKKGVKLRIGNVCYTVFGVRTDRAGAFLRPVNGDGPAFFHPWADMKSAIPEVVYAAVMAQMSTVAELAVKTWAAEVTAS